MFGSVVIRFNGALAARDLFDVLIIIVWVIYGGGRKNDSPEQRVTGSQESRGYEGFQRNSDQPRQRDMKQERLRFSWRGRDEEEQHYTTHKAGYKHKRGLR